VTRETSRERIDCTAEAQRAGNVLQTEDTKHIPSIGEDRDSTPNSLGFLGAHVDQSSSAVTISNATQYE